MRLQNLLDGVEITKISGDPNPVIKGVVSDHREVQPNYAFICYQGVRVDGHKYIRGAIQNGARVIISEKPTINLPEQITTVITPNGRKAQAISAANWYGNPAKRLKLIGITGTNGKTSTAHFIYEILKTQGFKAAVLGTIGHTIETQDPTSIIEIPALLTTPDAFQLHDMFKQIADSGTEYVVMETSSQGLAQHRLAGLSFDTAVFTNLTQDHLDYHENMENYLSAKMMLFDQLSDNGVAILNGDSPTTEQIVESISHQQILKYGVQNDVDIKAENISISLKELVFSAIIQDNGISKFLTPHLTKINASILLLGSFNIYNALAAIGVALRYNCNPQAISTGLGSTVVPGRFERIPSFKENDFAVIVDYAHTPDGLKNVLTAARDLTNRRLISVFGCGGDRDKEKRSKMGKISTDIADFSVITSDNPRTENPDEIISDIVSNLPHGAAYLCIEDRREAIRHAIMNADSNDVVVIAGKGHENYQEIQGQRYPFDDREVASEILQHLS